MVSNQWQLSSKNSSTWFCQVVEAEMLSRQAGCDPQNYRGLLLTSDEVRCCSSLFTSSRSKASGSNSPPTQSSISSCSGCSGSRIASSKLAYPQTPPQFSGGQARLPVRQTG